MPASFSVMRFRPFGSVSDLRTGRTRALLTTIGRCRQYRRVFGADVNRKTLPRWHDPMLPATVPVRVSSLSSGGTGLIPEMSKDYPKSTGEIEMLRVGMWASDHRDGFTAAPLSPSQTPIHCPKTQSQKYQSCRSEVDHRSLPHRAVNYADLLDAR